ncbi:MULTISPECIES: ATP-binding protein [unclassified Nocardioides]|uniref:ATP-binding protein n=1 Tax=unclassified Nocardioides TaxID=2615069 RepID=UPI0006F9C9C3|nr:MULTISPECIES: LuxR family transcriptional regulator [unclassified Nocardioides]KQY56443.1 hypothetical protein ASD30_08865 [Nocardioides sp. Root140]KRF14280.1 hypothetical protein ASH02_07975 [Nocardioides sp. Soil796]
MPTFSGRTHATVDHVAASSTCVGRDGELASASAALSTGRALIVIEGEPGIGKSRMVSEILGAANLRPSAVLMLAGLPMPDTFPLGLLADGLRRHARRRDDLETALAELSPLGGCLHALLPDWSSLLPPPLPPEDDPRATRRRLRAALVELVGVLDIEVVVLEDAHWSDAATLEWLLLLDGADDGPSLLVTDRPSEVPDSSPLLRLRSRGNSPGTYLRLTLQALDVDAVARLTSAMLDGAEISHAFAAFLREHTDGVPLAVEESIRLLRERHDIELRDGRWARRALDEIGVPPSVVDSVRERLTRLPEPARRLLEAAAVLAEDATSDTLHSVAHGDTSTGADEIESMAAALSSGLLREVRPDRYAFRHSLDAEAVLASADAPRVRALHRRALEALARDEGASVVRLAHHAKEAGDTTRWRGYAEQAADVAIDTGDDETAILTLVAIIESTDQWSSPALSAIIGKLDAARAIGGGTSIATGSRAAEALQRVIDRRVLDGAQLGTAMLVRARLLWVIHRERDAYELFEESVPLLEERPQEAERAMVNLALPMIDEWPIARHLSWLDRVDTLFATEPQVMPALEGRATALLMAGHPEGWQALETVLGQPGRDSSPSQMLNVIGATFPWGRLHETRRLLEREAQSVAAANHPRLDDIWLLRSVQLDWYSGAWDQARVSIARLDERTDEPYLDDPTETAYADALDCFGRTPGDAVKRLEEVAARLARSESVLPTCLDPASTLAHLAVSSGDFETALAHTRSMAEMVTRREAWLWAVEFTVSHVDALLGKGDVPAAVEFVDRFEAGTSGLDAPAAQAVVHESRAALALAAGESREAIALAQEAARQWAAMPRLHRELLALERLGACLIGADRVPEAVGELEAVHERLRELGSVHDAARVARTLRAHGSRTGRPEVNGRTGYGDQLSPREREVLQLVARGMTNKEAAAALFLSPKTVGLHLGSAMRKLGVHTRTAAAIAATQAGLIENSSPDR